MKVQYCSDLHLEFPENRKYLAANPLIPEGDILLLAGDIVCLRDLKKAQGLIDFAGDNYSQVYWLPGNHEYYGSDIAEKPNPLWESIRRNVHLVNNQIVDHRGIRFIFSTLWGWIHPNHHWNIERSVSDFSAITYEGQRFTARNFTILHEESLEFLKNALQSAGDSLSVVVTHHVPTKINYPTVYKNSPITEAFAVELSDLIESSGPCWWIYGHHHVNTPSFKIGKTRMLTNQLGYVQYNEHGSFRCNALFLINEGNSE